MERRLPVGGSTDAVTLVADREHCIETVARNVYRECVAACLAEELPDTRLARRLEILGRFPVRADFGRMRRVCAPFLEEGLVVRFSLREGEDGVHWCAEARPDPRPGASTPGAERAEVAHGVLAPGAPAAEPPVT